MKVLRKVLTNSIAIAVTVVHWIVVLFALYGEEHTTPFHFIYEPLLTQWLFWLNILPIIFVGIITAPMIAFFGGNSLTFGFCSLFGLLAITFQWLIVGYFVANFIDSIKPKEVKLTLNDK